MVDFNTRCKMFLLLLLLLSRFIRVRLCATPQMETHQAPPSLGYSRQEYWSGLPFFICLNDSAKLSQHYSLPHSNGTELTVEFQWFLDFFHQDPLENLMIPMSPQLQKKIYKNIIYNIKITLTTKKRQALKLETICVI